MSNKHFETTVVCIRHGESDANVLLHNSPSLCNTQSKETKELLKTAGPDPALTQKGREQAAATAQHLKDVLLKTMDETMVHVFVSPMQRAKETLAAFQQDESHPLSIKKTIETVDEMVEYDADVHGDASAFVMQIFKLFHLVQKKAATTLFEPRTLILFGHSLAFSTLFYIIATHLVGQSDDEHVKLVLARLCNKDRPKFLNCIYHLPNCSISVARATPSTLDSAASSTSGSATPSTSDGAIRWSILGVGNHEHLRARNLSTGHHSDF